MLVEVDVLLVVALVLVLVVAITICSLTVCSCIRLLALIGILDMCLEVDDEDDDEVEEEMIGVELDVGSGGLDSIALTRAAAIVVAEREDEEPAELFVLLLDWC